MEKLKLIEKFIFNDEVQDILSKINDKIMNFNILEITGMGDYEIRHSNILSSLFGANEHNLQYEILDSFLKKDIENSLDENKKDKLKHYLYLQNQKRDITIYREKDNIDLLIVDEENKKIFVIENKVNAYERVDGEDGGQLQKYENIVNAKYDKSYEKYFIFLTKDSQKPSKDYWLVASYQMIADVIENILKTKELTQKTKIVLESYVDLLKRRGIVADKKLEELCRQIWANENYKNALEILCKNKPTNHKIISDLIIKELENIGINNIKLYANKNNDLIFKTKSIDDKSKMEFNLDFDYWGIRLALYIDVDDANYTIYHKTLFPHKNKKNHRNQIFIETEEWDKYISDISIENLANSIEKDLKKIIDKIQEIDKQIKKIGKK